jgi:membrane-bound lytic murein transglycosylase D
VVAKQTFSTIAATLLAAACAHPANTSAPVPARSSAPAEAPVVQQVQIPVAVSVPPTQTTPSRADSAQVLSSDIAKRALEVFGDSAGPRMAPDSAVAAPSWDIDVESYQSTNRVEHYVRMFTGPAKERIAARLESGTRFEPMIRARMRDGGIPEDMYYLALVESGFDPNAYSRAAAVGMWQFMTSTARDMGMRVDWWVDERRDPMKSTIAAVRFLKGLREQFGSLYLAAAAYNGGPGRIARGLTRYADDLEGTSGDDLFFALAEKNYLRNETREYVPQLIAAALIAKDPDRYGMKIGRLAPYAYDSVRVGPSTPLAAVAHAASEKLSSVQELNPHVLRGITPPRDSFFVRLPVGSAEGFEEAFACLPRSERVGFRTVESKKGENFASLGKREGLTARQLSQFNPKARTLKSGNLAPGQAILIPTAAVAAAATSAPDPSIERYSSSRGSTTHIVKSGETLGGIALKYHTSTSALMRSNGLRRPLIFPGQSLIVARGGSARSVAVKSTKSSTSKAAKTPAAKKPTTKVATKTGASKKGAR